MTRRNLLVHLKEISFHLDSLIKELDPDDGAADGEPDEDDPQLSLFSN